MVKYHAGKGKGVMAIDAILVSGIGRYVVQQLAHTDHVVVAGSTATIDTGMVIGTRAECTSAMAIHAILVIYSARVIGIRRHMI